MTNAVPNRRQTILTGFSPSHPFAVADSHARPRLRFCSSFWEALAIGAERPGRLHLGPGVRVPLPDGWRVALARLKDGLGKWGAR